MTRSASSRSDARAGGKKRGISRAKALPAEALDVLHDAGGDMTPYLDYVRAHRPGREVQRVNVDFPVDLLKAIDQEARRIGVTRQAFIKLRLADTLGPSRSY